MEGLGSVMYEHEKGKKFSLPSEKAFLSICMHLFVLSAGVNHMWGITMAADKFVNSTFFQQDFFCSLSKFLMSPVNTLDSYYSIRHFGTQAHHLCFLSVNDLILFRALPLQTWQTFEV